MWLNVLCNSCTVPYLLFLSVRFFPRVESTSGGYSNSTILLSSITTFTLMCEGLDADLIGKNETIRTIATAVSNTYTAALTYTSEQVLSYSLCSDETQHQYLLYICCLQITAASSLNTRITTLVTTVTTRITEVQTMLSDATGSTVSVTVPTIPVKDEGSEVDSGK